MLLILNASIIDIITLAVCVLLGKLSGYRIQVMWQA